MKYLLVTLPCKPDIQEILVAELEQLDYDSFWEQEEALEAYIQADLFSEKNLEEVTGRYGISYEVETVEEKNWNVEWEKNFEPIVVADQCLVRADFHSIGQDYPHEIIINPKMAFGTGHHATTYLMLQQQLQLDHQGKTVLDAGCGTGILSIFAEQKGASYVLAYDNNEWAVNNTLENLTINNCQRIGVMQGTIANVKPFEYDIVLANINRNVLLEEIPEYVKYLAPGGSLLLSGFYNFDTGRIKAVAEESKLQLLNTLERNDWQLLLYRKP